jgi:signal transduction histidine kinase
MTTTERVALEELERDAETPATSPVRNPVRILHWEECAGDADLVRDALTAEGLACEISAVSDAGEVRRELVGREFDVVVAGARPAALDPGTVIDLVRGSHPAVPVVFFLSVRSEDLAVEALHAGAADYVSKHRALDLAPAVVRAISRARELRLREDRDAAMRIRLEGELQQARKMEAVGRLAGGVAHDFNNLLTTIIGFGYMLRESLPADDVRREYVGEISKASERAATLTRQLLAFSRRQVMDNDALNLNDALQGATGMLRDLLGDRVKVSLQLGEFRRIRMDPARLDQILIELVLNARDAMPDGGSLTIQTSDAGVEGVGLSVSDTGKGMNAETLTRVFEPFFTTKAGAQGRGLGLSTVYGIVKQSGGSIGVSSVPGQGSRFDLLLPKAADDVVSPSPAAPAGGRRGVETILVVEDEPPVRMLVRRALLTRGYTVLEAGSAEDALALAAEKQGPIDLMLTDSVLPGASGPALARELAATRPDMKVLFVSGGSADGVLQDRGLAHGQAFLQKPFELDVLAGKVRELLDCEMPALTA